MHRTLLFVVTDAGTLQSPRKSPTLTVQGYVTLRPEDDEDMYHIYNLISPGDQVRALAVRRVQTTSSTGSSDSYRVRVQLQLSVTKTDFSQAASGSAAGPGGGTGGGGGGLASNGTSNDKRGEGTASLQISGQVVNENEYVRLGAFHTLDLEGECTLFYLGAGYPGYGRVDTATVLRPVLFPQPQHGDSRCAQHSMG